MRKMMIRKALVGILAENPEGLTAHQILDKLPKRDTRRVINPQHISNLLKGLKNVRKIKKGSTIEGTTQKFKVNIYFYDDEGAEV